MTSHRIPVIKATGVLCLEAVLAPLLVVPFRQFLWVLALQPYFPRRLPDESLKQLRRIDGWHRSGPELRQYLGRLRTADFRS